MRKATEVHKQLGHNLITKNNHHPHDYGHHASRGIALKSSTPNNQQQQNVHPAKKGNKDLSSMVRP
ncbi:hypothetical protein Ahy_B06g080972 isoform D [Arachis hypogaea]|uniref:Uncharacterized protein n=1 Tax=Arachis hypogaea TaxID=3818 RepID=A0A444YJK4_ARAHY|nr:hypothetical protein Ahy_B06g080972 isoform D [Arachis hypogaea]